jgi:hypothetical protein
VRALDVGAGALPAIAESLGRAATELDGTGSSAPTAIDAGPWTALVSSMVAGLGNAAASVAEGVGAAGRAVLDAEATYAGADEAARQSLQPRSGVGAR